MRGGGQERGGRAGTESVAAIAAFGAAARACLAELDGEPARLSGLRDRLTIAIRSVAVDAVVFAETAPRLAALNHGTVISPVPGREGGLVLPDFRRVAGNGPEPRRDEDRPSLRN